MQRCLSRLLFGGFMLGILAAPIWSHAEEKPVVIPAGNSIKPEGAGKETAVPGSKKGTKKHKTAVPVSIMVKSGESFMIQMATVLSSGLTRQGETVYFIATEDVGKGRPVIAAGAVGKGLVKEVKSDKKQGKVVVALDSIQAVNGESVPVGGEVAVEGQDGQAAVAFGEKFTATLDEKVTVRPRPASRKKSVEPDVKRGSAEIRGNGVKADIHKGIVRGTVEVLLEAPKGMTVEDLDTGSVSLYKVNNFELPQPLMAAASKMKVGDRNKNGVPDVNLLFDAWDFIKYQPRGNNVVSFKGRMKNGVEFEATAGASIDY